MNIIKWSEIYDINNYRVELVKVDDPENCSSYEYDHYRYYVHRNGNTYRIDFDTKDWPDVKEMLYKRYKNTIHTELKFDNHRLFYSAPEVRRLKWRTVIVH